MGWEVEDIDATVRELRARGVKFEEYDLPGLKTANGIAEIAGNYASKGVAQRGAGSATAKAIFLVSDSQFDPDVPVEDRCACGPNGSWSCCRAAKTRATISSIVLLTARVVF
ncbi:MULTISPECIES: hypothetical protein [Bradyrhizobium]|uniref:hypothetical protein n=1 Tax=Bradyrhizobium TaxID=374 RepID=UPI001FEFA095|nr:MULTISPECIES: hypothetical protein [Bradyrhizobium]